MLAPGRDEEPAAPDASSVGAQMLYTSGTTGKPKGALRTGTNAQIVFALLGELGFQMGNEVHITTGPMYHSGPLAFVSLNHSAGSPIIVLRRFDPEAWLNAVKLHQVTNTFSAPTQLKRIVSLPDAVLATADCSSMRCLIANAAPVPYALKQEVIAKLGDGFLFEVYGSTEMGIITVLRPEDQLRKPGSCGKPYGGIEFRIVKDDGTVAGAGGAGRALHVDRARDGRVPPHRGAAQRVRGRQVEVGRRHRVRRRRGLPLHLRPQEGHDHLRRREHLPAEIEAVLHGHPQVLDVAVFGIPDDEWGESVYCIVQPKAGETLDLDELRAFAEAHMAKYKVPRGWEMRDELRAPTPASCSSGCSATSSGPTAPSERGRMAPAPRSVPGRADTVGSRIEGVVATHGIPVPDERIVPDAAAAVDAAGPSATPSSSSSTATRSPTRPSGASFVSTSPTPPRSSGRPMSCSAPRPLTTARSSLLVAPMLRGNRS